jgi:hypothetical protein
MYKYNIAAVKSSKIEFGVYKKAAVFFNSNCKSKLNKRRIKDMCSVLFLQP